MLGADTADVTVMTENDALTAAERSPRSGT